MSSGRFRRSFLPQEDDFQVIAMVPFQIPHDALVSQIDLMRVLPVMVKVLLQSFDDLWSVGLKRQLASVVEAAW